MTPSFWDHVEGLRSMLIRCVIGWVVCAAAMFIFRDVLFSILFAPSQPDFILYRALCRLASLIHWSGLCPPAFTPLFINTQLAAQFTVHLQVAGVAGLILAFPNILYQLYKFVAPALYIHERHAATRIIGWGSMLFIGGVVLNYFVIFPFAFRFLSTYQVYPEVVNQISLTSYISTLLVLSLLMGLLFEMPMVAWALSRAGILQADVLCKYRKHAIVVLCIIAAIITPTGDAFTLLLVTVPLYLLYEASILVIKK